MACLKVSTSYRQSCCDQFEEFVKSALGHLSLSAIEAELTPTGDMAPHSCDIHVIKQLKCI